MASSTYHHRLGRGARTKMNSTCDICMVADNDILFVGGAQLYVSVENMYEKCDQNVGSK